MVRIYLVASLLAAAASSLAAGPRSKVAKSVRVPGAYIFELENDQDVSAFEQSITGDGETRMKLEFELFNGLSFQLHNIKTAKEKVAKYAAMPAVKAVHPVMLYDMPNPKVKWIAPKGSTFEQSGLVPRAEGGPDTFSPHVMTQVDKLRAKGITGKGIKVAVVDTGIDYLHPDLGGCYGKGCLVSFGHDLVGDAYNGTNTPVPDEDPMDCAGHGTHVAGIVAAQNNSLGFTGTAPGVSLGAYRVLGCKGNVGNDVLIAAFNKAYQDGADIITSSIGGPSGWAGDPWAVTVSRIVDKGVPCVVAAGNEGDMGIFYSSTAANGQHVSAIASFDNVQKPSFLQLSKYQVNDGPEQPFGYEHSEISNWDGVNLPAWASSLDPTIKNDSCAPFPANIPDLSKFVVLIGRGTCLVSEKIQNAVAKGAKYVLVYNNETGTFSDLNLGQLTPDNVTAVSMINPETGEIFIKALKDGKKLTLKMVGPEKSGPWIQSVNNTDTGGAVSDFSTWGPTFEMDTKPQYGAIGGNVLSTYLRSEGSYAIYSGTSMSCPQAAGIIALIRQVRGAISPQEIEDLLSSNSNPQLFNDGTKFYDYLAPVPQQGGGLVQAYDAAYSTALLSPSSLSFNDTEHFAKSLNFTLRNTDSKPATYKIAHKPAITIYTLDNDSIYIYAFPNEAVHAAATLQFSETSITLSGGETKTIEVSATPPEGLDAKRLALWSGYITINGTDEASLSLPYQGLTGSLHEHVVLASNETWISESTDIFTVARPVPSNTTFTLPKPGTAGPNDLLPQLSVTLALGSPMIRADIIPLSPDPKNETLTHEFWGVKTIGQPHGFPVLWVPREYSGFPWDGLLDSGNYAPAGTYKFVVRALRINGDAKKKEEWDVSTSPDFSIKYIPVG
ncbi:hypothetical protein E4U19_001981 [Claviceps sp. Clav32 group G5]|nr:hypothetical protein E4U19_001981 [Claviceps sp. Clav32 group G5]